MSEQIDTQYLHEEELKKKRTDEIRSLFVEKYLLIMENIMDVQNILIQAFPETADMPAALQQLDDLKRCLDSFRPLNQGQLENLQEAYDTEYTYESNRIEGNTLTLQETYLVIAKGMTINGKSLDEHLEARNHKEAINYIRDIVQQNIPLTESLVNSIHSIILGGIRPRDAGHYRSVPVMISNAKHVPPQPYIVPKQMEDIFFWYGENADKLHPVQLAAEMHERIVTVHPWIDGNGRTSRLVMNLILLQYGYPIARIAGDDQSRYAYYNALEQAQADSNKEPFYRLVCHYVKASFFEYLAMVSGSMEGAHGGDGAYFYERIARYL
jgi:Fic family protein